MGGLGEVELSPARAARPQAKTKPIPNRAATVQRNGPVRCFESLAFMIYHSFASNDVIVKRNRVGACHQLPLNVSYHDNLK